MFILAPFDSSVIYEKLGYTRGFFAQRPSVMDCFFGNDNQISIDNSILRMFTFVNDLHSLRRSDAVGVKTMTERVYFSLLSIASMMALSQELFPVGYGTPWDSALQ